MNALFPLYHLLFYLNFQNFVITEGEYGNHFICPAIIRFQRGHPFLKMMLREQISNFDSSQWGNLGPTRWTSCKKEYCNLTKVNVGSVRSVSDPPPLKIEHCSPKNAKMRQDHGDTGSFSILNNYAAYSVPWRKWQAFYDKREVKYVDEMTRNSFAVHYWNHMRIFASNALLLDPHQPLYKIFQANCPATEKELLRKIIGLPY